MPRGLSTATKNILSSGAFITADLVELELDTPMYFTSAGYDLDVSTGTSGGTQTYFAQGKFMKHSPVSEREDPAINTISLVFTGVPSTFRDIALTDDFLHKNVRIYKAFFDTSDLSSLVDPIMWYQGKFTGASLTDGPSESIVTFTTSAHFSDFDYIAGRKTNDGSQQRFYPGDRFFQYSTEAISDIKWGKQ
jgi:hypothetical protein